MNNTSNSRIPNPYPGLRPFTMDESHLFFGREGQSETIVNYLSEFRFAAVTGASGSGKSSLIYCGVIPLLYGGFISHAGNTWRIITSRPGSSPIWNLAKAIAETAKHTQEQSAEDQENYFYSLLNRHSQGLSDALQQANPNAKGNYLLIIDQFEELFRYKESREKSKEHSDDPRAFIKLLVNIIEQQDIPVYVVLTMRSDFIGNCSDYQDLTALINKSNYLVPQMTRDDFEHVIKGPLKVAGIEMESRLIQEILNTIENNHDQLPVLQHVLMRTWEFWAKTNSPDTPINIRDYMAAGKLDNALSLHANEAFNRLDDNDKLICITIFKTLTDKGIEGKGIRRPATIREISETTLVQPDEIIRIIDVFREPGRSFLTPTYKTELTIESVIDISHESLMRVWDKLKIWVDEEASSAQMYLRLIEHAGLYQLGKSGLLRTPDLQLAVNWRKIQKPNKSWAKRYHPAFEKAMVFLSTSEKKFQQEEESKIKLQRRELYRTRRIAILLGVIAIAFFAMMFLTYRQRQEALSQKERAESYANIVEGEKEEVLERSKEQQLLLLRERERLDSLTKARQSQLLTNPEADKDYQVLIDEVTKRTEELEQTAQLYEREKQRIEELEKTAIEERSKAEHLTRSEVRKRMLVLSSAVAVKSIQADDSQLSGLLAYQAYLLNRENGGQSNHPEIYRSLYNALRALKNQNYNTLRGHTSPINTLVFDPVRNLLFSAETDGTVNRWGFRRPDPKPVPVLKNEDGVATIDITTDGRWMACGTENGEIVILNTQLANQNPRRFQAHTDRIVGLKFVPGKNALVSIGGDKEVKYWDLLTTEGSTILTDDSGFTDIDAHPAGKNLICASLNGKIISWDIAKKTKELIYAHNNTVHSISYDFEGERIAIGDREGKIILLSAYTGKEIKNYNAHASRILDLRYSPDNRFLASSGLDGVIRIWNIAAMNDLPIEIREHESWVKSITFSPDGRNLLSTSNDGNYIYIWPVKADEMAKEVCSFLTRQLTQREWDIFIGRDVPYRTACE